MIPDRASYPCACIAAAFASRAADDLAYRRTSLTKTTFEIDDDGRATSCRGGRTCSASGDSASHGHVDRNVHPSIRGSRYERLNLVFYSPLCIALTALVALGAAR